MGKSKKQPQLVEPDLMDSHIAVRGYVDNPRNRKPIMEDGSGSGSKAQKYNKYMSYAPRNNDDIAIPTWELTDEDLKNLSEEYIIAKVFTSEEMQRKIKDVMNPIVDLVLDGKEFSFKIPKRSVKYNSELCFPLVKRDEGCTNRNFYRLNCTRSAAMTSWIIKAIYENLKTESVITIRDLFYRCSILFQKQSASDKIVCDISLMFGCTRASLNLVSEEKGSVCGALSIKLKDGRTLDCSNGANIPDASLIHCLIYGEELDCIVVVEKGTIFNYLKRLSYHENQKCIVMTANGNPDTSSCSFLKLLQRDTKLPVFGVADPDPFGLDIMKVYAQGSMNLAHENFNLAVPSLMWVGLSLNDIEESGIELHEFNSVELSKKDKKMLDNLLSDKYIKLMPVWRAGAEKMRSVGRKTSFEVMHEKGYSYVAENLLPKLIRRARGIEVEPHK